MRILLLAAVGLLACGGDDGTPFTKGEYCDTIGAAACYRGQACGLGTFNGCFQSFKGSCCINNGSCMAVLPDSAVTLQTNCAQAITTHACAELAQGILPAACLMSP